MRPPCCRQHIVHVHATIFCRGKAAKDRTGVVAHVCDHVILHRAVMLTKGENWRQATLLIKEMLVAGVCPATILYDINCRFGTYFLKWLLRQRCLPASTVTAAKQIMFPLPPFHVNMHQASCRAEFGLTNPRFPAWIRPAGEPAEQMWAEIGQPHTVKYRTLHGGKLYLECNFAFLNHRADERLAKLLVKQLQALQHESANLKAEIQAAQLVAIAGADLGQIADHQVLYQLDAC